MIFLLMMKYGKVFSHRLCFFIEREGERSESMKFWMCEVISLYLERCIIVEEFLKENNIEE